MGRNTLPILLRRVKRRGRDFFSGIGFVIVAVLLLLLNLWFWGAFNGLS